MRYRVISLFICLALLGCAHTAQQVASETGFEGAVTVLSEETDDDFQVVLAEVPYLDIYGHPATGRARFTVLTALLESTAPIPAFCHVHYEKDVNASKKWARRGWAVFTADYTGADEDYPIDAAVANGNNLARAIIQWARRLPFIDRSRLHIDGGSQGGYMALAMSADLFPVTSATADAPVVNWAYNLNYFEANRAVSGYPGPIAESPLPVVCQVTLLADWCYRYFGKDLSADAWYQMSPIAWLGRIANPVLVTCATGDMLVPMECMTREHLRPVTHPGFPQGYQRDFDALTLNDSARRVFEEVVPPEDISITVAPLQKNAYEITRAMFQGEEKKPKDPRNLDKPWSAEHQWSLLYCDEGGPAPYAAHTTYSWAMSPDSFVAHYQEAVPAPGILNGPKLERLLERYAGRMTGLPLLKDGTPVHRRNFAAVEQYDVVRGLLDYAELGAGHAARLEALYAKCALQPLEKGVAPAALRGYLEKLALP